MHKRLKELRLERNYTVKDMAERLSISKPFYSQIENEKRRLSYEMSYKISKIFNLRPDDIFYISFAQKYHK